MSQRIVAIDDSDIAQAFIRASLADIGFEDVVGFLDPREALDAVKSGAVEADLILLDIMMPEIDGIELCALIREVDGWKDVPIIMLSSRKEVETLSQAFMAGANDYVTKPFSRIELQARMRSCLRLKSELDRRRAADSGQRTNRQMGTAPVSAMPFLLGSRAGFQANLLALSEEEGRAVGLIVIKLVSEEIRMQDDKRVQSDMNARVGEVLGKMQIAASEMFAHWDGDLFCLAVPNATIAKLEDSAQKCVAAVGNARLSVKVGWTRKPVDIVAYIVPPGRTSAANALAVGIKAAEEASRSNLAGVRTLDPRTMEAN